MNVRTNLLQLDTTVSARPFVTKSTEYLRNLIVTNTKIANKRYKDMGEKIHLKTNSYLNRIFSVLSAYMVDNPEITYYLINQNILEIQSALGFVGGNTNGTTHDFIFTDSFLCSPYNPDIPEFKNGRFNLNEHRVCKCLYHESKVVSVDPKAYLESSSKAIFEFDLALMGAIYFQLYLDYRNGRSKGKKVFFIKGDIARDYIYLPMMSEIANLAYFNVFINSIIDDDDSFIDLEETPKLSITYTEMGNSIERSIIDTHRYIDSSSYSNLAYPLIETSLLTGTALNLLDNNVAPILVDTTLQVLLYKKFSYYFEFNTPSRDKVRHLLAPFQVESWTRILKDNNSKAIFKEWLTVN